MTGPKMRRGSLGKLPFMNLGTSVGSPPPFPQAHLGSLNAIPACLRMSLAASLLVPASPSPNPYPPKVLGNDWKPFVAFVSFSHALPGTSSQIAPKFGFAELSSLRSLGRRTRFPNGLSKLLPWWYPPNVSPSASLRKQ